ncbi:MAG: UpxY family transcription antiterminator [Muribaculaceae bacterium]|nr:UpxY family transcription antiterminator [Muribaculaceae bacterium]
MDIENDKNADNAPQWFAMRDLKRPNATVRAYQQLANDGFEVFTPLKWELKTSRGKRIRRQIPYVFDLLFVRSTRAALDPKVKETSTLQYRFVKGSKATPMVVRDTDMERFIKAATASDDAKYYLPDEIAPEMYGKAIKIVGGPLDNIDGHLLSVKGLRKKRLIVSLPGFFSVAVEVNPEYIRFI